MAIVTVTGYGSNRISKNLIENIDYLIKPNGVVDVINEDIIGINVSYNNNHKPNRQQKRHSKII